MPDYTAEIAALTAAIASGATELRYTDYTVRYDSFDKMVARLEWLKRQQDGGSSRPKVSLASFSRGDA
jgi:hypothetical protein